MAMKLRIGNLPDETTDSDVRTMFEEFGSVKSIQVIMDRDSGLSKGFAFVEMGNDQQAQAAVNSLNNREMDGRALTVDVVKPRKDGGGWWNDSANSGGGRRH